MVTVSVLPLLLGTLKKEIRRDVDKRIINTKRIISAFLTNFPTSFFSLFYIIAYLYKKENKLYNDCMRKYLLMLVCLCLVALSGCNIGNRENTDTRIMMDTVVSITADCSSDTISEAFNLCYDLEKKLSRTIEGSDISKINNSDSFVEVGKETLFLINKSLMYSRLSGGKFDITICPVSSLYDFSSDSLPNAEDISKALSKVDYRKIQVDGNCVALKDSSIDLGGIAKGYIADRLVEFLKQNGAQEGIVNVGGNVCCFGKKQVNIGIKKPFSNDIIATVRGGESAYVTSGIYERYIKKDGKIYHHIIDPLTGYGVENDLAGVTIISKSSADADALSTVCMLLGLDEGLNLIENTSDSEAVFVKKDGSIIVSNGLCIKNNVITFK